jgi:G:T-mismatch repair DNA endonuclease (very short patch repair protein)
MAGLKWTIQEDEFILKNYPNMNVDELAIALNRTRSATDVRLRFLGFRRAKDKISNFWSDHQIQILKNNYQSLSRSKLSKLIGQSENNIRNKLVELELVTSEKRKPYKVKESKRFYQWTEEKISFLKENFNSVPLKSLCEHFNCSVATIARKGKSLGLPSTRRQTMPEKIVEDMLKKLCVDYSKEVYIKFHQFICDFIVDDVVIEVQGDYWHGNPLFYQDHQLDRIQLINVNKDKRKKEVLNSLGYNVFYLWENDLIKSHDKCFENLKLCLLYKKTP